MGQSISLFSDYKQAENRVTNYCGLVLKMLYQENPGAFEKLLQRLCQDDDQSLQIHPHFEQQVRSKKVDLERGSVPDLCISQSSFLIYFETKLDDWFYSDQLERHLNDLKRHSAAIKVLFLLTSEFDSDIDSKIKDIQSKQSEIQDDTKIYPITFSDLLSALKEVESLTSSSFQSTLLEFGQYLEDQELLSSWKYTLDIVNCGRTTSELELGLYACPNTKGSYHHKRAQYFGAYVSKAVQWVAMLRAIVVVKKGRTTAKVKWNNTETPNQALEQEAIELLSKCDAQRLRESDQIDLQVFLLGEKYPVDFQKVSPGGMFASKRYFVYPEAKSIEDLQQILNSKKCWE